MLRRFVVIIGFVLVCLVNCHHARCALVTISTSTATGTESRNASNDFIGLLSNNSPNQVLGQNVGFNNIPTGETFAIGDLVGRDIDASGGGRVWTYQLVLPGDASPGSGFVDIEFDAHTFERSINNLEGNDEITWELFLNGGTTAVDSATTGTGQDFTSLDISLSDAGAASVSSVEVVFTIIGFNAGSEWFSSYGVLAASYDTPAAVPEPSLVSLMLVALVGISGRRRRCSTDR